MRRQTETRRVEGEINKAVVMRQIFFFKKEEKKKGRKKVVLRAGVSKESSKALERHCSQRNFYICVHIHVTGEVFQSDKAA